LENSYARAAGRSLGQAAPNISTFLRAYPIFQMIERSTVNKASSKIGRTLPAVDGHIQFRNVHFSYPSRPDVVILDRFSLDFPAGKIVAGSGSGKSTVVSLIERFYEPLSGSILLDGHDIKELDVKWLRRQIGLVNQEPALFATNILYGKGDATMEEINHAAKLSEAITFINHLPDRYETQVGERGIQLSGGQNQRIAISRARCGAELDAVICGVKLGAKIHGVEVFFLFFGRVNRHVRSHAAHSQKPRRRVPWRRGV
jgi:ATP-binding cassette subfamily B (MDR/TAP) protein 1